MVALVSIATKLQKKYNFIANTRSLCILTDHSVRHEFVFTLHKISDQLDLRNEQTKCRAE
jgi:hypothetical protein